MSGGLPCILTWASLVSKTFAMSAMAPAGTYAMSTQHDMSRQADRSSQQSTM